MVVIQWHAKVRIHPKSSRSKNVVLEIHDDENNSKYQHGMSSSTYSTTTSDTQTSSNQGNASSYNYTSSNTTNNTGSSNDRGHSSR